MISEQLRALIDVNGTLMPHKKREYGLLVTQPVNDQFFQSLKRIGEVPHYQLPFEEKMRRVLPIEDTMTRVLWWPFVPLNNQNWRVLGKHDWSRGQVEKSWRTLGRRMMITPSFDEYFKDYSLNMAEVEALARLHERGVAHTIVSGIPDSARELFYEKIGSVLPYLDQRNGIILRPNDNCSGVHTKLAAAWFFQHQAVGQRERIIAFEDDYYVAEVLAGLCNMAVYMPIDERTARSQNHSFERIYPQGWSHENGKIHFNMTIAEVAGELKTH